jgi:hypothetical protein
MNDDDDLIVRQRIAGRSVRAIAKALNIGVAEVNRAIDRWAETVVNPALRKQTLALELARLDEMQLVFYERALEGDVPSGAPVAKLIERRGVMLGLHTPQTAVLQIVDEAKPRETSTDRLEAALNRLIAERKEPVDEARWLSSSRPMRTMREPTEEQLEFERLDALAAPFFEKALAGDAEALEAYLKFVDRKILLLGQDRTGARH